MDGSNRQTESPAADETPTQQDVDNASEEVASSPSAWPPPGIELIDDMDDMDELTPNTSASSEASLDIPSMDYDELPFLLEPPSPAPERSESEPDFFPLLSNPDFAAPVQRPEDSLRTLLGATKGLQMEGDFEAMCTVCGTATTNRCGTCQYARYCSRECQRADWSLHKHLCHDFKMAPDAARPSRGHFRVLYFPVNEVKPTISWGETSPDASDLCEGFRLSDMVRFAEQCGFDILQYQQVDPLNLVVRHSSQEPSDRLFCRRLVALRFVARRLCAPRYLNQSINALAKPGHLSFQFGPIAVLAVEADQTGRVSQFYDITPREARVAVHNWERLTCICVANPELFHEEVTSGLKINDLESAYNIMAGVKLSHEPVHVRLSPTTGYDHPIALAFLLGLRWYLQPGNAMTARFRAVMRAKFLKWGIWHDDKLRYLSFVATSADLKVIETIAQNKIVKQAKYVDIICLRWPFVASVVLRHGSGKPINWHHVLAFNRYLDSVLEAGDVPTKEGFEAWWAEYEKKLKKIPVAMPAIPSPYAYESPDFKDVVGMFHPELVMSNMQQLARKNWSRILEDLAEGDRATSEPIRRLVSRATVERAVGNVSRPQAASPHLDDSASV